jgi:putative resolvase
MLLRLGQRPLVFMPGCHPTSRKPTWSARLPGYRSGQRRPALCPGVIPRAESRPGAPGCPAIAVASAGRLYARVSSHEQKADLERQVARLSQWAAQAGSTVVRVEAEVGSGMNGRRTKARRLLADPEVTAVVVEHRDRLGRMNTHLIEAALSASSRRLVVLDEGEVEDDLVRDMVEDLTSFCARLYGRRSARNRAAKALEAAAHG